MEHILIVSSNVFQRTLKDSIKLEANLSQFKTMITTFHRLGADQVDLLLIEWYRHKEQLLKEGAQCKMLKITKSQLNSDVDRLSTAT